jgi:glucose-1-phosphate cytidylyltransferase
LRECEFASYSLKEAAVQVVILCGGQGTRIRDVADDVPKPMIPIGGQPILCHIMKWYAAAGFKDFVLCLGYKSWAIKQFFLDYHLAQTDITVALGANPSVCIHNASDTQDWRVTLAETGSSTMTGGRVKRIEKYIQGDSFMLTYGDGLADIDLHELLEFHRRHGRLATVTAVRPPGRFGELDVDDGRVVNFAEKPVLSRGYINGGFFVLQRDFFKRLSDDPGLILEQTPLAELTEDGELAAFAHHGFWHPMDNSRDYRYLNELWDQKKAPWAVDQSASLRVASYSWSGVDENAQ